jgi:hypothetical protein
MVFGPMQITPVVLTSEIFDGQCTKCTNVSQHLEVRFIQRLRRFAFLGSIVRSTMGRFIMVIAAVWSTAGAGCEVCLNLRPRARQRLRCQAFIMAKISTEAGH